MIHRNLVVGEVTQLPDEHTYRVNAKEVDTSTTYSRGVQVSDGFQTLKETIEQFKTFKYLCRAPLAGLLSEEQLRHQETIITGIPSLDRSAAGAWVERWLSVEQMLMVYRRGFVFSIVDRDDAAEVFKHVENYLHTYSREIQYAFTVSQELLQDLIDLDSMAEALFPYTVDTTSQMLRNAIDARLAVIIGSRPEDVTERRYNAMKPWLESMRG